MPDVESGLAQAFYLANMFAQKGTCNCEACQLLRQCTDGMIKQALGGITPGAGPGIQEVMKAAQAGADLKEPSSQEVP